MRTNYTLQYTLFSRFEYCTPKCVPNVQYSTPYFHFFKCCTPNAYLLYPTVHHNFHSQVLYTKMRTYCTVQYTLFSLFKVLYTKCVPTIHYSTHYFPVWSTVHQNAYLLYSTVHLIYIFSIAVLQMRTYNTLQYTLFSLFKYCKPKCVPTVQYTTLYFHVFKYCTPNA